MCFPSFQPCGCEVSYQMLRSLGDGAAGNLKTPPGEKVVGNSGKEAS